MDAARQTKAVIPPLKKGFQMHATGNIKSTVALITPERAAHLLSRNQNNRPLSKQHAAELTRVMKRGEWQLNGDSIRIDTNANILDGQHRLTACVQSGITFESVILTGLSPEVFGTIDRGKGRTIGEILSISGVPNYNMVAGASRMAITRNKCGLPESGQASHRTTAVEVGQFLDENPDMIDAAHYVAGKSWLRKYLGASRSAYCVFEFRRYAPSRADDFMEALCSGSGLDSASPVLALRDRIVAEKTAVTKLGRVHTTALVFKAFDKFLSNSKVRNLYVRVRGEKEEDLRKIFNLSGDA